MHWIGRNRALGERGGIRCASLVLVLTMLVPAPLAAQDEAEQDEAEAEQGEATEGQDDGAEAEGAEGEEEPDPDDGKTTEEREEDAKVHFRLGRVFYESGRFVEAAQEFEQAYEMSGRSELLYNVFLARRDAGQLDQAVQALEKYLEEVPDADNRSALEARLRTMRRLQAQRVEGEGEDGEGEGGEGTGSGEGEGEGRAGGGPQGEGTGEGGTAEGPAAPPIEDETGSSSLPWIVGGVGVGLLAGGVITGVLALKKESDLEDRCRPIGGGTYACDPGFGDTKSRGEALATATDVLIVSGLAAVGAGLALLFLLDGDGPGEQPTASVGCGPGGCAGSVRMSF